MVRSSRPVIHGSRCVTYILRFFVHSLSLRLSTFHCVCSLTIQYIAIIIITVHSFAQSSVNKFHFVVLLSLRSLFRLDAHTYPHPRRHTWTHAACAALLQLYWSWNEGSVQTVCVHRNCHARNTRIRDIPIQQLRGTFCWKNFLCSREFCSPWGYLGFLFSFWYFFISIAPTYTPIHITNTHRDGERESYTCTMCFSCCLAYILPCFKMNKFKRITIQYVHFVVRFTLNFTEWLFLPPWSRHFNRV